MNNLFVKNHNLDLNIFYIFLHMVIFFHELLIHELYKMQYNNLYIQPMLLFFFLLDLLLDFLMLMNNISSLIYKKLHIKFLKIILSELKIYFLLKDVENLICLLMQIQDKVNEHLSLANFCLFDNTMDDNIELSNHNPILYIGNIGEYILKNRLKMTFF